MDTHASPFPYFVWLYTSITAAAIVVPRYPKVGVLLAVGCLPAAYYLPLSAGLRAFFGIASLFYHLRVWQMAVRPANYAHLSWQMRLIQTIMFFDLSHARKVDAVRRRSIVKSALVESAVRFAVAAAFTVGCKLLSGHIPPREVGDSLALKDVIHGAPVWICTMCAWFAHLLVMCPLFRLFFAMFELESPRLFNEPLKANSLGEFWGKRWNRAVQPLLSDLIYTPLVSHGFPRDIAVVTTFLGSGILHAYPLVVGSGLPWTGVWACAYFVAQAIIMLAERHVSRMWWGSSAHSVGAGGKGATGKDKSPREVHLAGSSAARNIRRLRTLLFVVLPAPLIMHPLLHVIVHN